VGSADRTVKIWHTDGWRSAAVLGGHLGEVNALALSPDGRRLASGSFDRTIRIWDLATMEQVMVLLGHAGGVSGLTFSPYGKRLASASQGGTTKIWDIEDGRELFSLRTDSQSVAFSPDGLRLAIGCGNGEILIMEADPWWEPGNPPKRPKPSRIEIKPVPETMPAGVGKADDQF
jgi:WD40 repeat protein